MRAEIKQSMYDARKILDADIPSGFDKIYEILHKVQANIPKREHGDEWQLFYVMICRWLIRKFPEHELTQKFFEHCIEHHESNWTQREIKHMSNFLSEEFLFGMETKNEIQAFPRRFERAEYVLSNRVSNFVLVCDHIGFFNVLAMTRTAEVLGIQEVWKVNCESLDVGDRLKKKMDRSADLWVDSKKFSNPAGCIFELKAQHYEIWVCHVSETATKLDHEFLADLSIEKPKKLAIVMGSEKSGPSDLFLKYADRIVFLPQYGFLESLNVSVACGMVLNFVFLKFPALREAFDEEKKAKLREDWYGKLANSSAAKDMADDMLKNPPEQSIFQQPYHKIAE